MAHALLQHSAPQGLLCRSSTAPVARRRVLSRVAFTRVDSALGEVHSSSNGAVASSKQKAAALVAVAEPPLEQAQPPAVATMSLDTEQLQQLMLEEYKRGYEAGAAAAREAMPTPEKELVHDSVTRTAAKSFTWRVLSTATTVTLALLLFNDSIAADAAMELGAVEFLSKYGLYFVHERAWAAITFLL